MDKSGDNNSSFGPLVEKMRRREIYLHAFCLVLFAIVLFMVGNSLYQRGYTDAVQDRIIDDDTLKRAFNACVAIVRKVK